MSGLYNRILVPLDGSEIASQALPHAIELAASGGAELVLLRVVPNLNIEVALKGYVPTFETHVGQQQSLIDHATRWLERIREEAMLRKLKTVVEVEIGEAADKIVDYATQEGIDLVVMSTHGHTGVARWRYGSVATKVLESVKCPVLLVHAQLPGETGKVEQQEVATS
jgi:nucleotide-binding universal stress UspA family protein